ERVEEDRVRADALLPCHAVDDERVVHDRGAGVAPVGRDQPPEHPWDGRQVGRLAVRRHEHGRPEPVVAVLECLEHVEVRTQLTVLVTQLLELDVRRRHTVRVEERHGWRRYYTAGLARSEPSRRVAERASRERFYFLWGLCGFWEPCTVWDLPCCVWC